MYLNCHTYYSLRYGTIAPRKLVETASRWGIDTLVLTDINNTSCAFEFADLCISAGIKPILGMEFRRDGHLLYIAIAQNADGFEEINRFYSEYSLSGKVLPDRAPRFKRVYVVYPKWHAPISDLLPHEFLGVRPEGVNRLAVEGLSRHLHKLVVWSPVVFLQEQDFILHQLLRAIDLNTVLSKLQPEDMAAKTALLLPPELLHAYFKQYPQIIQNTSRLLDACSVELDTGMHLNRQHFTGTVEGDYQLLEKLAVKGCEQRYGPANRRALERVQQELRVIRHQNFCAYFLIAWDIIRYAKTTGYQHVGRGSGANSIVAFCLYITDVDPLELDLYFERFINPHRTAPPDFDIDFSWDERDDLLDYVFKRYGKEHTALLATYNTFKGRSIIRELGKVLGLPKADIDHMVANPDKVAEHHPLARQIMHYGKRLSGFPNYLSIHAGGIIITEKPIFRYTALDLMPKGFPITHFDMYHAEQLGFHKFDILSQRGLGHLKDAVELIRANRGQHVDIHDIAKIKQDPAVKQLLRSGRCMGCFYIESPAMRGLLQKLRCDNYVHLVAASSIIRPGVASSGMMREYIRRFHDPASVVYVHPSFKEHLGETFGVMVYQEDVMKIVHHFAGLDLQESDVLRRMMSGKKHSSDTFERLRQKFFYNCKERGHSDELAQEVWRQIESFSGYSFCKAHSASFAVESFQSLYLKAYFPLEFMVAVINNFGGFYKAAFYFHEARMQGANILAPCVNHSNYLTTIQGNTIYVGFVHLQQMERRLAHEIAYQRSKQGAFRSLEDFICRVAASSEQLDILIRIGAFRFTGKNKYELVWEKNAHLQSKHQPGSGRGLFDREPEVFQLPELTEGTFDQAFDEIELLGFPLQSPFDLLEPYECQGCIQASELLSHDNRIVRILGYFVCRKPVTTVKDQIMHFGTWIDPAGHFFDTVHFPNFLQYFPFKGPGIYAIKGKVTTDFEHPSIEVLSMERLPYVRDKRY